MKKSKMTQAEILFKQLDNTQLAKIALEMLDCHVLITSGGYLSDKKSFLESHNIPSSKYFDFIKLSENTEWNDPYIFSDENLPYLGDDIINSQEKTLILNAVDSTITRESKVYQFLAEMSKHGKRMIVVMYPDDIDTVKSLFGVVITLKMNKLRLQRVQKVELIS
ncbi:hypothetical protein [Providencia huashanensis]